LIRRALDFDGDELACLLNNCDRNIKPRIQYTTDNRTDLTIEQYREGCTDDLR